jgi:hypothetical protein
VQLRPSSLKVSYPQVHHIPPLTLNTGNSIALYGNTDTDHGAFAIAIDGGESINLSATAPESRQGTLLVSRPDLLQLWHNLILALV